MGMVERCGGTVVAWVLGLSLIGGLAAPSRADVDEQRSLAAEVLVLRNLLGEIEIRGHTGERFEVEVRVLFPVERAEAAQRPVGRAVRKGFAKLRSRAVGVTESSHELSFMNACRELEQIQAGHVHRCFAVFEIQKSRVQKIDSVHVCYLLVAYPSGGARDTNGFSGL